MLLSQNISLSNNLINADFGIKSELEYDVFMYSYLYDYINSVSPTNMFYMCTWAKHANTNILFLLSISMYRFVSI